MSNIFMKIEGIKDKVIKGNVTTAGHVDSIALHSVNFNTEREMMQKVGNIHNRSDSLPYFSEVTITKSLDSATDSLFQCLCKATNMPTVEIKVCSEANPNPKVIYTLTNVLVAQHSHGVVVGSTPVETLRLNYTQLQITYNHTDEKNTQISSSTAKFDLKTAQAA